MKQSFRNIFVIALSAVMVVGQAVTALADERPDDWISFGPGYDWSGSSGSTDTSGSASDTGNTGSEAEQPAPSVPSSGVAADVQEVINGHYLTMRLLRSDPDWSEVGYVNANSGSSVSSPQGILSMSLFSVGLPGDIMYRAYSSASGWSRWVMNGDHIPWTGGVLLEAIQIRLKGVANDYYDVSYSCTLSDGSTCGWSYNGKTNGTMGAGKYITGVTLYMSSKGAYDTSGTSGLVSSSTGYDGIQFGAGLPTYVSGTGQPFTGWAWNGNDQYYFVDSSAVTGWQYIDGYKYYFDGNGKLVTDLEPVVGAAGPYMIRINKQMNCTTIYIKDGDNGFITPYKSFLCSTGDDTPLGTFQSPEKYRWHEMIHGVYCQYLTRLGSGLHILLHSDIYASPNVNTLSPESYNRMGIARSAGCIRYVVRDAKWIYDNCPLGTTIEVYNSSVPSPFERPCVDYLISWDQTWDPTDPEAVALYGTLYTGG